MARHPSTVVPLHRPATGGSLMEERDDETLMRLAARDHRGAFEVVVRRHLGAVTRYCAKFLGDGRLGEEVAQDAFVEVWERRRAYRPGRLRVLLYTVARHRCLNRLRAEARRAARGEAPWDGEQADAAAGDPRPDQLDALLERERLARTRQALLRLAPKLREAVLLRFDQGLDYAEIARVVGRPEVTVRSRVFLAVRRLRDLLAKEDDR